MVNLVKLIQLVESLAGPFDKYLTGKIAQALCHSEDIAAYSRHNKCDGIVDESAITNYNDGEYYFVDSQSISGFSYRVDPSDCTCTCTQGEAGNSCKHLVAVHVYTVRSLHIFPPVYPEEKEIYHEIAFGKKPPHPNYYGLPTNRKLAWTINSTSTDVALSPEIAAAAATTAVALAETTMPHNSSDSVVYESSSVDSDESTDHFEIMEAKKIEMLRKQLRSLDTYLSMNPGVDIAIAEDLVDATEKLLKKTPHEVSTVVHKLKKLTNKRGRKQGYISPSPTSVGRRKHNLGKNVKLNQANPK